MWPIPVVQEELISEIVHIVVDVHDVTNLLVDFCILRIGSEVFRQVVPVIECIACTTLLYITRIHTHLERVNHIVVRSQVGICPVLVAWFTHIQHSDILTIHKHVSRLNRLKVQLEARMTSNLLQRNILQTVFVVVVVSTVSQQYRLVSVIWLIAKERVIIFAGAMQAFCFQFERLRQILPAPSTSDGVVHLLVHSHHTILTHLVL